MNDEQSCQKMSKDALATKLKEKIDKTGFPLELRVADYLQRNGYHVAQGVSYVDRDEGKSRELDIRALKNETYLEADEKLWIRHCFSIECKKSAPPWVVFTSKRTSYDGDGFGQLVSDGLSEGVLGRVTASAADFLAKHPFEWNAVRGRQVYEPFKSGEDAVGAYSAIRGAVKALVAQRTGNFAACTNSECMYYPMVVLDGRLFEAFLGDQGEVQIDEIQSALLTFRHESSAYKNETFTVPIVTWQGFPTLIDEFDGLLAWMRECAESTTRED